MKKILITMVIIGSALSYADVSDNVEVSEEEFYGTKIGTTVQRMEERHKRIVILDKTINKKIDEFYSLYNKAKEYTKNSECSMLELSILNLNNKVDMYQVDESNSTKIDFAGLKQMIVNLESNKNTICKRK